MHRLSVRELLIELAILVGVTLLIALLGPFGTFEIGSLADRLVYWALMIFGGYAIVRPLMVAAPVLADRLAFPEAAVWTALVLLAAVPVTLLVWFGGGATELPTFAAFLRLYPNVAVLGGMVAFLFWLRRRQAPVVRSAPAAAPPPPAPPTEAQPARAPDLTPPLIRRLPPHKQGTLHALEMEDHYVRVHTTAGQHLVLMRMRDAVAEVADVEGEQVHRSWWVARAAVEGHAVDGRSLRLKLPGGLEAPVARSSVPRLRALGWVP
jgi:hypothetical protein